MFDVDCRSFKKFACRANISQEMYANIFTKSRYCLLVGCMRVYVFTMGFECIFHAYTRYLIQHLYMYMCIFVPKPMLVHKLITIITVITDDDMYFAFVWRGITVLDSLLSVFAFRISLPDFLVLLGLSPIPAPWSM